MTHFDVVTDRGLNLLENSNRSLLPGGKNEGKDRVGFNDGPELLGKGFILKRPPCSSRKKKKMITKREGILKIDYLFSFGAFLKGGRGALF